MNKAPTVKSLMTPFPYTVDIDAPISQASDILEEHDFHHLPVTDNGDLCGVISSRDITLSQTLQSEFNTEFPMTVRSVCNPIPFSADINSNLAEVLNEVTKRKVGSVVITKDGHVAGIITMTDICNALRDLVKEGTPQDPEAA